MEVDSPLILHLLIKTVLHLSLLHHLKRLRDVRCIHFWLVSVLHGYALWLGCSRVVTLSHCVLLRLHLAHYRSL